MNYHFTGEENIDSPSLIYYHDIIKENIHKAISLAGGIHRLWPHIKTHKNAGLIKMQLECGINRFKCATIAEAEMCAKTCEAFKDTNILVAYPLVGTAIERFIKLTNKYPGTCFWAIGDDLAQLELLGKAAMANNCHIFVLIDVNLGMDRTGVLPELLESFYIKANKINGLKIKGFHCYDGHLNNSDLKERKDAANSAAEKFWKIKESLDKQGYEIPVIVMGGTPTFSCHRQIPDIYLSPGTFFVQDYGYNSKFKDLDFNMGAAILSRVISHPNKGLFTIDTGTKAIATDPAVRGIIIDLPQAKPVLHNEEHWVWSIQENQMPPIGTVIYVIPFHICPTSALYSHVTVVKDGKVLDTWEVGARNRKITI